MEGTARECQRKCSDPSTRDEHGRRCVAVEHSSHDPNDRDKCAFAWDCSDLSGWSKGTVYKRSTHSLSEGKRELKNSGESCGRNKLCKECEGDCDTDSDCALGLKCYQRQSSEDIPPGCAAGGSGDKSTSDYCYD